jgi:hypothetical protein
MHAPGSFLRMKGRSLYKYFNPSGIFSPSKLEVIELGPKKHYEKNHPAPYHLPGVGGLCTCHKHSYARAYGHTCSARRD